MSPILSCSSERKLICAEPRNTSLENHGVFCVSPSQTSGCSQRWRWDVTSEKQMVFQDVRELDGGQIGLHLLFGKM